MKNKGYTIMEAVIAMFLVLVMVGAVFSALMSGRRAITASSEREEVLYSLQSAYTMFKDCRANADCHLHNTLGLNCSEAIFGTGPHSLKDCNALFTFNFKNLCKDEQHGAFNFKVLNSLSNPQVILSTPTAEGTTTVSLQDFYVLGIDANCED